MEDNELFVKAKNVLTTVLHNIDKSNYSYDNLLCYKDFDKDVLINYSKLPNFYSEYQKYTFELLACYYMGDENLAIEKVLHEAVTKDLNISIITNIFGIIFNKPHFLLVINGTLLACAVTSSEVDPIDMNIFSNVHKIADHAFAHNPNIRSINMCSSDINIIDEYAFMECPNLVSVVLPNNLYRIDNYAFYGCRKIRSIDIPKSVYSIGTGAFNKCTALRSVTLPSKPQIKWDTFNNTPVEDEVNRIYRQ